MRQCLSGEDMPLLSPFYGMMDYHLGWRDEELRSAEGHTGKQLRPLLCLLACQVVSGRWRPALPAAAAVELLHNFTLIHDDIEDHSPLRRGRPAVWRLWGIPQAINVGDGLFVLARMALLRLRGQLSSPEVILQAVEVLDRAVRRICEGQYLDLSFEGRIDVDEAAYIQMIRRKTAELLAASVQLGVLVGGGDAPVQGQWRTFGLALGLAFQIQDDLLGVWGDEARTGKPAAADVYGRKLVLPVVHALAHADAGDRRVLERVYGGDGPISEEDVAAVLAVLERTGTRDYVEQRAGAYHGQALVVLQSMPGVPARDLLEEIVRALLGRRS